MNIYIVGLNENSFEDADGSKVIFDVLEICKANNSKTIQTPSLIDGLTKWESSAYMPNLNGFKRIDEAQTALAESKLAEKEALKVRYQQESDKLVNLKYGDVIVKIFTIVDPASFPKTAEANQFVMDVNAHALAICNAIDVNEPYEFDLSQFTCDITAQEIQTEIQGA